VRGPMAKPPRDRRTQPAPERAYERADPRIDRLEDTISHFYNVINELRERVSTLEKKLKFLAKDELHQLNQLADDRVSGTDADRHDAISRNGSSWFGGNTDSAETADLARVLINAQISATFS